MKPLLCLLFCCSFALLAQSQWSEADCVKAAKKLQQLEQKISSGYSLKEAEQLSLDQRQLEKQLDQFCQKPVLAADQKKPKTKKSEVKKTAKTKDAADPLADIAKGPQLYVSSVSVKAPYQGKNYRHGWSITPNLNNVLAYGTADKWSGAWSNASKPKRILSDNGSKNSHYLNQNDKLRPVEFWSIFL